MIFIPYRTVSYGRFDFRILVTKVFMNIYKKSELIPLADIRT